MDIFKRSIRNYRVCDMPTEVGEPTVAWLRTGFSTDAQVSNFDLNKISEANAACS